MNPLSEKYPGISPVSSQTNNEMTFASRVIVQVFDLHDSTVTWESNNLYIIKPAVSDHSFTSKNFKIERGLLP